MKCHFPLNPSDGCSQTTWLCSSVFILLIDPLPPHEDFGFTVQRERAVVFPEAVKQLQVFELAVLIAHWKHTRMHRLVWRLWPIHVGVLYDKWRKKKQTCHIMETWEFLLCLNKAGSIIKYWMYIWDEAKIVNYLCMNFNYRGRGSRSNEKKVVGRYIGAKLAETRWIIY